MEDNTIMLSFVCLDWRKTSSWIFNGMEILKMQLKNSFLELFVCLVKGFLKEFILFVFVLY